MYKNVIIIKYYDSDIQKIMIYIKYNHVIGYNIKIKGQINLIIIKLYYITLIYFVIHLNFCWSKNYVIIKFLMIMVTLYPPWRSLSSSEGFKYLLILLQIQHLQVFQFEMEWHLCLFQVFSSQFVENLPSTPSNS